jgi:hypothetical protein
MLPGELAFVYEGSGFDIETGVGAAFGLVGALVASAVSAAKKKRAEQYLEGKTLDELMTDDKRSFRASASELLDVRIDPSSFWTGAIHSVNAHAGILRFGHPEKRRMTLCIDSVDDMKVAVENIRRTLGGHIAINVEWDERKKKFVGKP